MRRQMMLAVVVLAMSGLPLSDAARAADAAKGKSVFSRCAACHSLAPGQNRLGPSLAGVVGRKAAAVPGFNYSPAMKKSGITWTGVALDKYLADPRKTVPGNRMVFFGLPGSSDRADLVAYLATIKGK